MNLYPAFSIDAKLFVSTFALIFLAELPDKTVFATLLLATRHHPVAVFLGVAAAFLVQNAVAVLFGSFLALLPPDPVRVVAGLLFLIFAVLAWRRSPDEESGAGAAKRKALGFARTVLTSFTVIFVAEWGDLTQLAAATLCAKTAQPLTIFLAATSALWVVTALAIAVGNRAAKLVKPRLLERFAAVAFAGVGVLLLTGVYR